MTTPTDKSEVSITKPMSESEINSVFNENVALAWGEDRKQIARLQSQLTDLRAQVEKSGERCEKLSTDKRRLADENAELKALLIKRREQIDKANADGAVMRQLLPLIECKCDSASFGGYTCPRCEAISTDAGRDLLARYREAVELLSNGSEILNEVAAYGNCECDIPSGKTCIPCECAMHNNAVATLLAKVKGEVES